MSDITTSECIVCRKHKGEIDIPGGSSMKTVLSLFLTLNYGETRKSII